MHICYLSSEYPLWQNGGLGSFLQTISRQLVLMGHQVTIVGIGKTDSEVKIDDKGVQIYRLAHPKFRYFKFYQNIKSINTKLKIIHKKHPIDIVESPEQGLFLIKKLKEIKYVIRLHGGHHFFAEGENRGVNFWQGLKEKRSFKKADAFIAVSKYVKIQTSKYLSFNNKPIEIINYPIDLDLFRPMPEVQLEPYNITFVGTVCEKKGVRQLIEAMPAVLKSFPQVKLNIYGRDWFDVQNRSYIEMLRSKYAEIIDQYVTFHGSVPFKDIPKCYAKAQICVFPSHVETQGLVAPEAMAMGKLVVFTELGPGKETIEHMETGLLCNPYDSESIAMQIIWVLKNKKESLVIAKKGIKFSKQKFNLVHIVNKNLDFYSLLLT
ncbi:glycosyltransferase family 4 protein [Paucihalobacter sp.]|uniref:glycosyltransferase family 4 protein n=1 Tax=Paucihalobacter sp. TaxID=2850405 RepID=UPI002FE0F681